MSEWLSISIPPGVEWRIESRWNGAALLLNVGEDFDRESVGSALFALAVQAMREKSLRGGGSPNEEPAA